MHIQIDFRGKHVFVFGGTTGINFGIAHAFAEQQANVTVASRKAENVKVALDQLSQFGGSTHGVCADVRNYDAVGRAFAEAVARFGPIDVLVSGAAGNFLCEAKEMSSNGFKVVVDIDLIGTFHVMRQAHAYLRKPGSSVINITAPQSFVPMRFQAHAGAAKAGVDQLTKILALEWGIEGIRLNSISPGPIEGTEGFKRLMARSPEEHAFGESSVPLKRFGTLDDIANLALFLGSPYSGYISGAVIPCDGGGAIESVKPALENAGYAAKNDNGNGSRGDHS